MTKHIAGFILFSFIVGTAVTVNFAVSYAVKSFSPASVKVIKTAEVKRKKRKKKRKKRRCNYERRHHEFDFDAHYAN